VEEISALNIPDAFVSDPWVSPDNLRMYYFRTGGGRARIMLTKRASTNDLWLPGTEINELSILGNVYNPDLTADELTIVFSGVNLPGGQGGLDIWIANRPDTNSPFGNVTNLAEINSSALDAHPYISPDGLTLYFASDRNNASVSQLFKATRESLDAPFGNLEHLSFFDSPDSSVQYPFLSSDGSAFYFGKWKSGEMMDIYVSYVSTPRWSQPVPVTEVNTEYTEGSPFLSFDGLSLYFARLGTNIFLYGRIYEARRDKPFGPFTSVREISELNQPRTHVLCPWVSSDNLRMYYHTEQSGVGWRLKFSKRASVNNPWPQGTDISELNLLGTYLQMPKLTSDELTIFFNAANMSGGKGGHDIWMTTRPDRNSPFGQVRNLNEINTALHEVHPCPSPDGLELYFTSNRNGNFQLFRATRESLDAPFGNVEHLSFFDTPGGNSSSPCITSDGRTFYFARALPGQPPDIWVSYISEIPETKTYYVDAVNGNDNNNGLKLETAFATIQKGINTAEDGDKVLVYPGLYQEPIDFLGKAITVQGVATDAGIPVIENTSDFAVLIYHEEGPDCILKNFVIEKSFMAIFIAGSSPTISNVTVVYNKYGIAAYAGSEPDISNCIFWNNTDVDLFGCQAQYSRTPEQGQGNVDADPCFADPGNSDYHLLSRRGRYWPEHDVWVLDKVTSPCVDGGDPNDNPADEPMPNGGRIDMGAYGGTPYASMSEWPLAGDINHDGVVDLVDMAIFCNDWLSFLPWVE
jgi:parallel beta-helix repeat protein